MRHVIVGLVVAAGVVGCGGGGGSSNVRPDQAEETVIGTAHLTAIEAPQAHAVGAKGAGVTVAVLDSGFRTTHDEFATATLLSGYNVADGNTDISDVKSNSHGTRVASLIAGKNVGVAPQATLMPVRMLHDDGSFAYTDIAAAMDYARTNGAKIQNISATMINLPVIATALDASAAAGMLTVVAAGNEGDVNPDPHYLLDPAQSGITALAVSRTLVVGAVTNDGVLWASSDRAGTLKSRYLVAPGVSVNGADRSADDAYSTGTGTSFAAPLVSGAAAVVWAADPSLAAEDVADILLVTADDLGAPGVDDVYGYGMLNLARALQPVGLLGVPAGDASSAPRLLAAGTGVRLGAAFGDALTSSPALSSVVALDDYNRPYTLDMSGTVVRAAGSNALLARVASATADTSQMSADLLGMRVGLTSTAPDRLRYIGNNQEMVGDERPTMALSLSGQAGLINYQYAERAQAASLVGSDSLAGGNWVAATAGDTAHLGLAASNSRAALAGTQGGRWMMQAGLVTGKSATGSLPVSAGIANWRYAGDHAVWTATLTHVTEEGAFLGSVSTGALGAGTKSATSALGIGVVVPLGERLQLVGGYSAGITHVGAQDGSMLRNWSAIRTSAYSAGAAYAVDAGRELGFRVVRPLRVDQGTVDLDVPIERRLDHTVVRAAMRADLSPSGNETDIEAYYSLHASRGQSLSMRVMHRMEPGHVRAAPSETAALIEGAWRW